MDESRDRYLTARHDEPLITIPLEDNRVRYFASKDDADAAIGQDSIQKALDLAGAWHDLDGDEMLAALDRIRIGERVRDNSAIRLALRMCEE